MSSLTMCSGQEVVLQIEMKEKECVVKDIRNKSSQSVLVEFGIDNLDLGSLLVFMSQIS